MSHTPIFDEFATTNRAEYLEVNRIVDEFRRRRPPKRMIRYRELPIPRAVDDDDPDQ